MKMIGIHCQRAAELISKKQDHPLSLKELFLLYTHLSMCKVCTLYSKQIEQLDKVFQNRPVATDTPQTNPLSPEDLQKMQDLIDKNK